MNYGQENANDCWCMWGTLNYSFCAYYKKTMEEMKEVELNPFNSTSKVESGRCPAVTGENLLCSDLASLGNCYGKAYACTVDSTGMCHCSGV